MPLEAAPFYHDVAPGPKEGAAYWTHSSDGLRIRVAAWPLTGARGTVILMPGRTEYIEKYAQIAADMAEGGYAMMAVDWRGQGLADRLLEDARIGHVGTFQDYQLDVVALMQAAERLEMPRPWHVLGHSMGGAIALRAVHTGIDVVSATFTGPMWGITMHPLLRPVAYALSTLGDWTGQDHRIAPSTSYTTYVLDAGFDENLLTNDRATWDHMGAQARAYPALTLGGPSVRWVGQALRECRALARLPAPALPALTFLGTCEGIVQPEAIHRQMDRWADGTLRMIPNGKHEVLMEDRATRTLVLEQMFHNFQSSTG